MPQKESPLIRAKIEIQLENELKARAVCFALRPDEKFKLEGLRIRTVQRGNSVVTHLLCKRGPKSMAETIDDLLRAVDLVLQVIDAH